MTGFKGALLRLHLLSGGQRIEQLVNLLTANIAADSILLLDGKGRPGRPPRPHIVPLIKEAQKALAECDPRGAYALSSDGGETHVAATTLSDWAADMAREQIERFQTKRIRSGIETLLASAGVSRDVRGRLQSHGVAGVQAHHYDGHDYVAEKRQALEILYKLLQKSERTVSRASRTNLRKGERPEEATRFKAPGAPRPAIVSSGHSKRKVGSGQPQANIPEPENSEAAQR
jgi:integrase